MFVLPYNTVVIVCFNVHRSIDDMNAAAKYPAARTPKGKGSQPRVAIVLHEDDKRRLGDIARAEGRSTAATARQLLLSAMAEREQAA